MKHIYFAIHFAVFVFGFLLRSAAQPDSSKQTTAYLSKEGLNRLLNLKFGSIVTGQSSSTSIGNYASFDPVGGSVSFKGSVGIGSKNDTAAQISYLTFRLQGDLISDSYTALFSNSKLNTNALFEIQYHLRLSKSGIRYFENDKAVLQLNKLMDAKDYHAKLQALFADSKTRQELLHQQELKYQLLQNDLQLYGAELKSIYNKQQEAAGKLDYDNLKILTAQADSLTAKIAKATVETTKVNAMTDSLSFVIAHDTELRNAAKLILNHSRDQKLVTLEASAVYSRMQLSWLTFIAGMSKKDFYTLDQSVTFTSQVAKQELSTFRLGIAANFYYENTTSRQASFLNLGVVRYKDNNTSLLSTQEMTQETVMKNAAGDTTRKISKKYNVYTDPIIESQVWNVFANWYFIQKGRTTAFHVYPSFDFYDNAENLANIGLGYIVSFKNTKKDQPIVNAEGYVQFQDIFNHLGAKPNFWSRSEIGIRFTLPFNFF